MSKVRHHATGQLLEIVNVVLTDNNGTRSEPVALAKGSQVLFLKAPKFDISGIIGYTTSYTDEPQFNDPFSMTLTPLSGYQALPWNTKVIMNGVDITSTAYNSSTGAISIANVTGDVSIEAEAVEMSSDYKPLEYIATRAAVVGNMITLPYYPNNNTKLVMDLLLLSKAYSCIYSVGLASAVSPNYFFWTTVHNTTVWRIKHGNAHQDTTSLAEGRIKFGERIIFSNDKGTVRYKNQNNGVYLYTYSGGTFNLSSNNLGIMAFTNSQSASQSGYPCSGNLWKVEISENGVMLLNYYPCKRISDNAVGIYDTVNGNAIIHSGYIAPYIAPTSSYTNCAATLLSSAKTGTAARAVIGSTWSIKITPSSGYYFVEDETTPVITFDGVDVSSDTSKVTIVYNSADNSYTLTILDVPDCAIGIEATAYDIIQFEDAAVKAICVENWGGNAVNGEITKTEAAAVTTLNGVFVGNTDVIKFNELQYFTGLTSLYKSGTGDSVQGQFYACSNLTEITMPEAEISDFRGVIRFTAIVDLDLTPITAESYRIDSFVQGSSSGTSALRTVKLPGGTLTNATRAFKRARGVTTLDIDGTLDFSQLSSASELFSNTNALTTITGVMTGIGLSISVSACPLTVASALVILNGLSSNGSSKTITFRSASKATYEADSDFNDAVSAATANGWTIAYA